MPLDTLPDAVVLPLFALWLFALGGAVGSFLNVVVYRLPLGMSLVHPSSRCPACEHPIRWHDNVPIFGWLLLGGRCRDCRASISARYPTIETIAAAMFVLVGIQVLASGGASLPQRPVPVPDGVIYTALGAGELLGVIGYHLLLLSTLLAATLIEYDGGRVPLRLAVPALVVGGLAPLVWPHLHPVPAGWLGGDALTGLFDSAAGLGLGLAIGGAAWRLLGPRDRLTLALGPACIGLFLGWQAIALLGPLVVVLHAIALAAGGLGPGPRRLTPGVWLTGATLAWILGWATMSDLMPSLPWGP